MLHGATIPSTLNDLHASSSFTYLPAILSLYWSWHICLLTAIWTAVWRQHYNLMYTGRNVYFHENNVWNCIILGKILCKKKCILGNIAYINAWIRINVPANAYEFSWRFSKRKITNKCGCGKQNVRMEKWETNRTWNWQIHPPVISNTFLFFLNLVYLQEEISLSLLLNQWRTGYYRVNEYSIQQLEQSLQQWVIVGWGVKAAIFCMRIGIVISVGGYVNLFAQHHWIPLIPVNQKPKIQLCV